MGVSIQHWQGETAHTPVPLLLKPSSLHYTQPPISMRNPVAQTGHRGGQGRQGTKAAGGRESGAGDNPLTSQAQSPKEQIWLPDVKDFLLGAEKGEMQAGRELLLHVDNKCFNCLQEERDKNDLWDSWRWLFGKNKFDTQFNPSRRPQTKLEMNAEKVVRCIYRWG